ncbi:MAG: hypothetical protein WAK20_06655 [Candidatus Acidiferrum sp.]
MQLRSRRTSPKSLKAQEYQLDSLSLLNVIGVRFYPSRRREGLKNHDPIILF